MTIEMTTEQKLLQLQQAASILANFEHCTVKFNGTRIYKHSYDLQKFGKHLRPEVLTGSCWHTFPERWRNNGKGNASKSKKSSPKRKDNHLRRFTHVSTAVEETLIEARTQYFRKRKANKPPHATVHTPLRRNTTILFPHFHTDRRKNFLKMKHCS